MRLFNKDIPNTLIFEIDNVNKAIEYFFSSSQKKIAVKGIPMKEIFTELQDESQLPSNIQTVNYMRNKDIFIAKKAQLKKEWVENWKEKNHLKK